MAQRRGSTRIGAPLVAMLALAVLAAARPAMAAAPNGCDIADVVAHALPAIVNITVVKVISGKGENEGSALDAASKTGIADTAPAGPHFQTFVGSGAIINPAGIIVTNRHVIKDGAQIRVTFSDKTQVPAQLIAAASMMDIAVLKVNVPEPLPTLQFANSDAVQPGQTAIAVGNPLGIGTSVSVGVVSGRDRNLMRTPFDDFIQTDATINPGNSGGPLLDCSGRIIGIDTALLSNNSVLGSIGIGFALPSNDVRFVSSKLIYPETDQPNWIGLHLQNLTARLATIFRRPAMTGAIVTVVDHDSPAAAAGLQPGDIIVGADGEPLGDAAAVLRYVVTRPEGATIELLVWRTGQMEEVTVRSEPWPHIRALRSDVLASPASVAEAQAAGLGLHLAPLTDTARARDHLDSRSGVLVDSVTAGSQAADAGIADGDVIERVGEAAATSPDQVMHLLALGAPSDGDLVAMLVDDKQATKWVALYVGRVYVANLLAAPLLPGGFGPVENAVAAP
ncbi:MAG TPA: trypsin-like peptidase domain-containing protein [Acetobacteraceae bacterium]|nr:trypsin-like peptidase domain-containing protein [Acetobacteraceae bacterium]